MRWTCLRKIVREAAIRHDGVECGVVTASLGVSSWSVGMTAVTPLSLVAAADAALYRAKSGGRDRVEVEAIEGGAVDKSP